MGITAGTDEECSEQRNVTVVDDDGSEEKSSFPDTLHDSID